MKTFRLYRIISAIPPMLLLVAATLILAGGLVPRHILYYPAILCIMGSGTLTMAILAIKFKSGDGLKLSVLNLLVCAALTIEFILSHMPVITSSDWKFGAIILLIYVADIALFYRFFHGKIITAKGVSKTMMMIIITSPIIASILFYWGIGAWIGLSIIVFAISPLIVTPMFSRHGCQ